MSSNGTVLVQTEQGVKDLTPYVRRLIFKNSLLTGHTSWALSFTSPDWDFWDKFMVGKGLTYNLKIRSVREGKPSETGWLGLVVDDSNAKVKRKKMQGTVRGGGKELGMMDRARRRAFPSSSASQVIRRIALEHSLTPNLGDSGATHTWYQANQTDWEMLQEVMGYFVASSDNRGDAYLNIDGLNLTVKPINFAKPSVRKYDLSNLRRDDRIDSFETHFYGGQVDRGGGIVVEARGFDASLGQAVTFTANPLTSGQPALANKLPQSFANKSIVVLEPHAEVQFVRARALREQARMGSRYYGISINVLNDLEIKLRDMIEVTLKDRRGRSSKFAGRYGVHEYVIDYSRRRIVTSVVCYRREASVGKAPAVGANVSASSGVDKQRSNASGRSVTTVTAVPLGT
jgi:hypothetical protein